MQKGGIDRDSLDGLALVQVDDEYLCGYVTAHVWMSRQRR